MSNFNSSINHVEEAFLKSSLFLNVLMHLIVLSSGLKIRILNILTGQPGHDGQNSQTGNPGQDS
jgi:hypothetical protein